MTTIRQIFFAFFLLSCCLIVRAEEQHSTNREQNTGPMIDSDDYSIEQVNNIVDASRMINPDCGDVTQVLRCVIIIVGHPNVEDPGTGNGDSPIDRLMCVKTITDFLTCLLPTPSTASDRPRQSAYTPPSTATSVVTSAY